MIDLDLRKSRLLITGAAGFLGSHLVEMFRNRGVDDLILPRRQDCDLTDQSATIELVARSRPDVVIHLAADVGGIGANQQNPGRFFYANLAMGLNLIEASRQHEVGKFVQVGTVCAYPKYTEVPFKEVDLWEGYPEESNAPYGVAKKALLVMLQAYRQQYGLDGIYLLPTNLYGPRDNFDRDRSHVIPALIRRFVEARESGRGEVEVWGTGNASREFLHAADAARAITMATESYDKPDPVNVGTGQEITIKELTSLIADLTGFDGVIRWNPEKPDGQPRRRLDIERARSEFGFEAEIPLEVGLKETIQWWESHRTPDDR